MNRREFLGVTTVSGIGLVAGGRMGLPSAEAFETQSTNSIGTSLIEPSAPTIAAFTPHKAGGSESL
jgi:hypothetical protein